MNATMHAPRPTRWRTLAGTVGLIWSLYGVFQFLMGTTASEAGLMASGMTPEQAALYAGLPLWMNVAFAVGVFGGTIGATLLLLGRRPARPVLAASLAGYVILFMGDIVEGVFAAFGSSQVIVLSLAVAISAGLLWLANDLKA